MQETERKSNFFPRISLWNLSLLLTILSILEPSQSIRPTRPILTIPNMESSPSNIFFYFELEEEISIGQYLMITFTPFVDEPIPQICEILSHGVHVQECLNVNKDNTGKEILSAMTLRRYSYINLTQTVILSFDQVLPVGEEIELHILLSTDLPTIPSISKSLQFYVASSEGIILQQNWNYGGLSLQGKNITALAVNALNMPIQAEPGAVYTNLALRISIHVNNTTPISRLAFVIEEGFEWTDSSLVSADDVSGQQAPTVLSTEFMARNTIVASFNESFLSGRELLIRIGEFVTPNKIQTRKISIYYLPYNSMGVLQFAESSVQIETIPYTPTLRILTVYGIPPVKPLFFFRNTLQYIKLEFQVNRRILSGFVMRVTSPDVTIHEGSVKAVATGVNMTGVVYRFRPDKRVFFVENLPQIDENVPITISLLGQLPDDVDFSFIVDISSNEENLNFPLITTSATSQTTPNNGFVSQFTGTLQPGGAGGDGGEKLFMSTDALDSAGMNFLVRHQSLPTDILTSLTIIMRKNIVLADPINVPVGCRINGTVRTCSFSDSLDYVNITIPGNSIGNSFPGNLEENIVTIENLRFTKASTHSDPFPIIYILKMTNQPNSQENYAYTLPLVIPKRNQLSVFRLYFLNNVRSPGWDYPNIVRVVSADVSEFSDSRIPLLPNEKRIISIFAYNGWQRLFEVTTSTYPAGSSDPAHNVIFEKGENVLFETNFFLTWDRVHIILSGTETTDKFSVALPTVFADGNIRYEVLIGKYNTLSQEATYLFIEAPAVAWTDTFLQPSTASMASIAKSIGTYCDFYGYSGSVSNVNCTVDPNSNIPGNIDYFGGLVIVSDWEWFKSDTVYSAATLSPPSPPPSRAIFGYEEQTPVGLQIPHTKRYLTFIPFTASGNINNPQTFTFNLLNVKLPFSGDLPNYNLYLTRGNGQLDSWIEYENYNRDAFYPHPLAPGTFTCVESKVGSPNTECTVIFTPKVEMQPGARIRIRVGGMSVNTDTCFLSPSTPGDSIPLECLSSVNKTELLVTLKNTDIVPPLEEYKLDFCGISISKLTTSHWATIQILDKSATYVIENVTRILGVNNEPVENIVITELNFEKSNPNIRSPLHINFMVPRNIFRDEKFVIQFNTDLAYLNRIESKIRVKLFDSTETETIVRYRLESEKGWIIFEPFLLQEGEKYRIDLYGLTTPSIMNRERLEIFYLRIFDQSKTIVSEPLFQVTPVSEVYKMDGEDIKFTTYFNTEGLEQEMEIFVVVKQVPVTPETVWIINFPRYFSPTLQNKPYLRYCTINGTKANCKLSETTPYELHISDSPLLADLNDNYTIRLYGIICPRSVYTNNVAEYGIEPIFFSIAENASSPVYSSYSELYLTTLIMSREIISYGLITLLGITSSNNEVNQATSIIIEMVSTVEIPTNTSLYITFPEMFDNFKDFDLTLELTQNNISKTYSAEVINRRLSIRLLDQSLNQGVSFFVRVASLPTPTKPQLFNGNEIEVFVAKEDLMETIAASMEGRNQILPFNFTEASLHIVINDYNPIQVTAGTSSEPISIRGSDFGPFVANVRIGFFSNIFTFEPESVEIFFGEFTGEFRVSAPQNLKPGTYSFDILKSESGISAMYTSLIKYSVVVTNIEKEVSLPSEIEVPLGGCSIPESIKVPTYPNQDLQLEFSYDSTLYDLNRFYMGQEISYNEMEFNSSIGERWMSFCSSTQMQVGDEIEVNVHLSGTNEKAYKIDKKITIKIVDNSTTNVPLVVGLELVQVLKTYSEIKVTTNVNSHLYWELSMVPFVDSSLMKLKTLIKEGYSILASESDELLRITPQIQDHRVGIQPLSSTSEYILRLEDLVPGTEYKLCGYFANQHNVVSPQQCVEMKTLEQKIFYKAELSFTKTLYESELNRVLCFFVKGASSTVRQIVNLDGNGCSLDDLPDNYYYRYVGSTNTTQLRKTIIYMMPDVNITDDNSLQRFLSLYNTTSITQTSLAQALNDFAIDYIAGSRLLGSFDPLMPINSEEGFTPSLQVSTISYNKNSRSIRVQGIRLSTPGIVYTILTLNRRINYDAITGHTDIEIRDPIMPTPEQIGNCEDGYGTSVGIQNCIRAIYYEEEMSVTFTEVYEDSLYTVYLVAANEYPLRPIFVGNVREFSILTVFEDVALVTFLALLVFFV